MSERRGMKTSTLAGILVGAGIGIGALLSYVLPELPFGIGTGWNGLGNPTKKASTAADPEATAQKPDQETSEAAPGISQSGPATGTGDSEVPTPVVYVIINGRDYLMRRDAEDKVSQKSATLQQIVKAVQEATGDENGVRVRILQRTTAKTTARLALLDALDKANIPRSAIRKPDEPIEE